MRLGIKNRILLYTLYLYRNTLPPDLYKLYKSLLKKYQMYKNALIKISNLLNKYRIKYAIIKSIRPYPVTTVDIDILLFLDYDDLIELNRILTESGYRFFASGPQSITYLDPNNDISIDFYINHVTSSRIVYLNGKIAEKYINKINYLNNTMYTLDPCLEVSLVAGHSVYKEQMVTLSDILITIDRMKKCKDATVGLTKAANMTYNSYPISYILSIIYKFINKEYLCLPIKLSVGDIIRAFYNKINDKCFLKSLLWQTIYLTNYNRLKTFILYLREHAFRETY
ncbi:MAG: hypothetical protein F7C38_05340 [Desulfurococcales archaeon]|nr:hypothetical protein [Desulfurococcales archaeon]